MNEATLKKLLFSLIISPLVMTFDPYVLMLKALGMLVMMDIMTGMLAARREGKDLTSRRFYTKCIQVGLFLFGLAAASHSSPLLLEFGIEAHQAGKWFCALYGAYELFSILENLGRLGFPIAKQFSELLKSKLPKQVQELPNSNDNV